MHQRPANDGLLQPLSRPEFCQNREEPKPWCPWEKALTGRDSLETLRCGHSRQRLPRPAGDTSRPVFEARSQLSVTGTPLGISVSGAVAAARGPEPHAF